MTAIVLPAPYTNGVGLLPFHLDLSCPIPLPPRATASVAWPFPISGHILSHEHPALHFRRRYLETLYLPEVIFPLELWLSEVKVLLEVDAADTKGSRPTDVIVESLLSLKQLEVRHRKTLFPIISRLISTPDGDANGESLSSSSDLKTDEVDVLKVAVELRMTSRAASEGHVPTARKMSSEFERREALMQVALLILLQSRAPASTEVTETKKRKRSKRESGEKSPAEDPLNALELLMDRIGVWNAVEEMEIASDDAPAVAGQETSFQITLKHFWRSIVVPHLLPFQTEVCSSFHLKVFGHPISPNLLVPPTTIKKPRKPKMTRSRPSTDAAPVIRRNSSSFSQSGQTIPVIRRNSSSFSQPPRPPSRAPSETGSRASADDPHGMRRSLSKTSESMPEYHQSRSRSIDPPGTGHDGAISFGDAGKQSRKFGRAPSGADLFKGRQVGFIRRPSGVIARKEKEPTQGGVVESQHRGGLLGRKKSDLLKASTESQGNERTEGTLIFATPSKPKLAETIFGPRLSKFVAPTPIQEEPSSGERSIAPSFIAETPVHVRHFDHTVHTSSHSSFALETPHLSTTRVVESATSIRFADMPISQLSAGDDDSDGTYEEDEEQDEDSGEESDDPLAELMVMTDEEVDGGDIVCESPI